MTARNHELTDDDFAFLSRKRDSAGNGHFDLPSNLTLQELERQAIAAAIQRMSGNIKETAAVLGIDRSTLYEKIKKYDIPRN